MIQANVIMYDKEVQAAAEQLSKSFKTMADTMSNVPADFKLMTRSKPLTEDEIESLYIEHFNNDNWLGFARAIEAAHRII